MSTTALPACHEASPQHAAYVARVEELEAEGCDTSDAQGIADMEFDQLLTPTKKPTKPSQKMKTTYSLLEIAKYRDTYTDEKGEEAANYNLPEGWQIGCILGEITPGDWTAIKTTATGTIEKVIKITK